MAGRPSAAQDAAKKEYEEAPPDAKPTARDLAAKHGLSEASIYRARWFREARGWQEPK